MYMLETGRMLECARLSLEKDGAEYNMKKAAEGPEKELATALFYESKRKFQERLDVCD